VVQSLMMPARQAMIPEIVGMRRLMNAVAINSAGMNSMRLFAPSIGGFLLAVVGPQWVYFIMTAGYFWAVAFLVRVPGTPSAEVLAERAESGRPQRRRQDAAGLLDGVRYIMREPTLRTVLGINVLLILMSMPYMFLLPGFVASVLHEGPEKLGLLMSFAGAGSLIGSLVIASLPPKRRGLLFLLASLFQGVMLIAFSASTWFWVTAPVMLVMGIGQAGRQSFSNVLVQTYSDDEHRGRVMSVYMMQFGLTSFGTFIVGVMAAIVGAQLALGATSVLMVLIALGALAFSPRLRNLA
jgi:MFS family permease